MLLRGLANRPEVTCGEIEPSTIGHAPAMIRGLLFLNAVDLIGAPDSLKSRYSKRHSSLAGPLRLLVCWYINCTIYIGHK